MHQTSSISENIYWITLGIGYSCSIIPMLTYLKSKFVDKIAISNPILVKLVFLYGLGNLWMFIFFFIDSSKDQIWINIYTIVELLLLIFLYKSMFPSRKYVLYFRLQLLLYIALTCWSFCTSPLSEDYLLLLLFQRILFIILPVIYLLKMYQTSEYMRLTQTPYFFLNISVLIYNVSTLFLSFFEKYIRYDQESLELFFCLWPFYNLGGAVFYVLFSIGLWKLRIRKVAAPK